MSCQSSIIHPLADVQICPFGIAIFRKRRGRCGVSCRETHGSEYIINGDAGHTADGSSRDKWSGGRVIGRYNNGGERQKGQAKVRHEHGREMNQQLVRSSVAAILLKSFGT